MKTSVMLLPKTKHILETVGYQIKLARLRRNISSQLLADRAGISRATVWQIEKGESSVSIGAYLKCLECLGLAESFSDIAKDDPVGRMYQDAGLKIAKKATR